MLNKFLVVFVLILVTIGMIAALLRQLKEMTIIKSPIINYFFRERFITKRRVVNKTELGKNLMIFFFGGLFVALTFNLFVYNEWDPFPFFYLISSVIIISQIIFARSIKNTALAKTLSGTLEQNIPISREYGEEGEIAPQFLAPKIMTRPQKLRGWIDLLFTVVLTIAFFIFFGSIVIQEIFFK